jgi:predicted Rossmann-fold nucleotide-binding protein
MADKSSRAQRGTRKPVIGVMGPAQAGVRELEDARALGELIARQGWILLTGGRASGVMEAASQGAKTVPGSLIQREFPIWKDGGESREPRSGSCEA